MCTKGEDSAPDKGVSRPFPAGALLFALALALAMAGYALSVFDTSRRITDWLLIVPVAVIGIASIGVAVLDDVIRRCALDEPTQGDGNGRIGAALVVLVLAYVGAASWIGFDLATAAFVALALVLQGERRPAVVLLISFLTAGLLVWLFKQAMGVPLPASLI